MLEVFHPVVPRLGGSAVCGFTLRMCCLCFVLGVSACVRINVWCVVVVCVVVVVGFVCCCCVSSVLLCACFCLLSVCECVWCVCVSV